MAIGVDGYFRNLAKLARQQGFTVEQTRGQHIRFTRDGFCYVTASTPGDRRSYRNCRAALVRMGLRPRAPRTVTKPLMHNAIVSGKPLGPISTPLAPVQTVTTGTRRKPGTVLGGTPVPSRTYRIDGLTVVLHARA